MATCFTHSRTKALGLAAGLGMLIGPAPAPVFGQQTIERDTKITGPPGTNRRTTA